MVFFAVDAPDATTYADYIRRTGSRPLAQEYLSPAEGEFIWHEVSTRVNRTANDDAQLILPITDEQRATEAAPKPAKRSAPRKAAPPSVDDGQGSLF